MSKSLLEQEDFIRIWNASVSVSQFIKITKMSRNTALVRASSLRKKGHDVKYFKRRIDPKTFINVWNRAATRDEVRKYFNLTRSQLSDRYNNLKYLGYEQYLKDIPPVNSAALKRKRMIKSLWIQGVELDEISQRVGLTYTTVQQIGKDLNLPWRGKRSQRINLDYFVKIWNDASSVQEVADILGKTYDYVNSTAYRLRKKGKSVKYFNPPKSCLL